MFDSKKRQVSMAHRTTRQTASSITEAARIERERRALDRLREKSALQIQKHVRGLLSRQRARAEFKQEFLKRITDVKRLERTLLSLNKITPEQRFLTTNQALSLLRMCLFCNDAGNVEMVNGLLLVVRRSRVAIEASPFVITSLAKFCIRAPSVRSLEDVFQPMNGLVNLAALAREATLRACASGGQHWVTLALQSLHVANGQVQRDAFLLAAESHFERAGDLFAQLESISALANALQENEQTVVVSKQRGIVELSLFGHELKPNNSASNKTKVFLALAGLTSKLGSDDDAVAFVRACERYFPSTLLPPLDQCVKFRDLARFPCAWAFLNQIHKAFEPTASPTERISLLCLDTNALSAMWRRTTDQTNDDALQYACKSTLQYINLLDDMELFSLDFLYDMIGKLKHTLFEQSLQRAVAMQRTQISALFCALFDRWSRKDDNDSLPIIPSSSSSMVVDESKIWLFPPQANLTSPRSRELLTLIPMVFPFEQRVKHFQETLRRAQTNDYDFEMDPTRFVMIKLNRQNLVDEAFRALREFDFSTARQRLRITFVSPLGLEEAGIGQGVFKEFLTQFCMQAFADQRLFSSTQRGTYYPTSTDRRDLPLYEFFGKVIGKAVCDGILIDSQLSPFVINVLLGRTNSVHDLQFLDSDFYVQLLSLKRHGEAVKDMGLSFSCWSNGAGEVDLVRNGREIPVTAANLDLYITALCDYKLNVEFAPQIQAIAQGFSTSVAGMELDMLALCQMFSSKEFAMVIGGSKRFAVADLRANCQYAGGYHASQEFIRDFWHVVGEEFTPEQQSKLLRFITSCSRPPLTGFAEMDPKVTIYQVRDDNERLPTSSTCVNLLKLPKYPTREILKEKLLMAIESDSGFELS